MTPVLAAMGLLPFSAADAPAQTAPQPDAQMPMPPASTPLPPAQMPMVPARMPVAPAETPMSPDMSAMDMYPYFSTINYAVPQDTMMVMPVSDLQRARTGADFATGMVMVQYGLTPRWTVGLMAEGQKISGHPVT